LDLLGTRQSTPKAVYKFDRKTLEVKSIIWLQDNVTVATKVNNLYLMMNHRKFFTLIAEGAKLL
jgi:hypothetical protein